MFRAFRIFILLTILLIVGGSTYLSQLRATDWDAPLWVSIFPINGDGSSNTERYINSLKKNNFRDIEAFMAEEAEYYKVPIKNPTIVNVANKVLEQPPLPPTSRSTLNIMLWSLKLRYWVFTHGSNASPSPDIQIYVVYYDPANNKKLSHSLGLEKGHIGVVHAYAGQRYTRKNNVIIAHEFLHTLGAVDKYELATNYPIFPLGFANPDNQPLYPQKRAEIMAGRMPVSKNEAIFPKNLYRVVIGKQTAKEINWLEK
ncbi:hypothetical protein MNBD_GAMMA23-594 [hydrothermal vent metagenome]|uniref:Uncharacterized protein n=1 Tax=hydrothermal vent metagenome TaxID=652676 RepID=A0A3B1ACR0_9ZZZZ